MCTLRISSMPPLMKTIITLCLFIFSIFTSCLQAQDPPAPHKLDSESIANIENALESEKPPGIALSQGVSEITGVAISPLMGISAVGAWRYFQAPEDKRSELKWYCSPLFWGTSLVLILFIQLKTFLPKPLSLPLDIADTWEDKISALLVSGTLVPDLVTQATADFSTAPAIASAANTSLDAYPLITVAAISFDYRLLFIPFGIAAFLVVWMTSHAINLLIILSPFSIVDLGLKALKIFLLGSVLISYLIHPILGAVVSFIYIATATFLAPRVFRFSFFVSLLSLDLVTPWRSKKTRKPENAHAFLSIKNCGAPKHTYGRISRTSDGATVFTYRPRLILKSKTIVLSDRALVLRKGILHPALLQESEGSAGYYTKIIVLPPRYRKGEHLVAQHLDIDDIRENEVLKGIAAIKAWCKDLTNKGKIKSTNNAEALS